MFEGIFKFAGKLRDYDISKREWVLDGDTVMYGAAFELKMALDYDFEQERNFNYKNLSIEEIVKHITFFVSRLWQIHAFGEGNTRTTAVFTIKYLRSLGFNVNNDIFAENSWYFRNALVRANYNNLQKGIQENPEFLERFFRNLLMGEHNELKNRYCHIKYSKQAEKKVTQKVTVNVTVKFTANQKKILEEIKKNQFVTQEKLAEIIGITRKSINENMKKLQSMNIIERVGADKNGYWKISEL